MYHDFVVVSDFKHDMILGIDFMNPRKALLDFENQTLIIGNPVFPLQQKPSQKKEEVNLVRLAEDVGRYLPTFGHSTQVLYFKEEAPGIKFCSLTVRVSTLL